MLKFLEQDRDSTAIFIYPTKVDSFYFSGNTRAYTFYLTRL